MPRLKNPEDLDRLYSEIIQSLKKSQESKTTIYVGMGTCGIAAGADETMKAILHEIEHHGVQVQVKRVGCIGICVKEPLVDVQVAGQPRITYTNVDPGKIPRIIQDHLINGQVVEEWAIGYVPFEW